ncbi:hypothetical protein IEQ34_017166 [Dendrobium chrysotoxum]|uniref:Uncharacterized protein n=1 Tax=Dendrobium chrysotoxum TaxID=161865 RepID=A0AAV7GAN3_DENCH|nr:hypothetical protein IEQ34_017166 [Dendrobium chrysotoxum]
MKVPTRSYRACFPPLRYITVAMSIIMGLIVLFRDHGVISDFFYVQNDWKLQEKWGKLKELPVPLHIGAEDLLKILKLPDLDALHYEVCYLSRYIDEEYLFKMGLSTQAGRSHAQILKRSVKVSEVIPQKNHSKQPGSDGDLQAPKKKKADEILAIASKGPPVSPSKSYIPEDVLKHQCIGHRRAETLGEYKKKYDKKVKEMKVVEDLLAKCRAELANRITSASSQNEQIDRLHIELVEAHAMINQ